MNKKNASARRVLISFFNQKEMAETSAALIRFAIIKHAAKMLGLMVNPNEPFTRNPSYFSGRTCPVLAFSICLLEITVKANLMFWSPGYSPDI